MPPATFQDKVHSSFIFNNPEPDRFGLYITQFVKEDKVFEIIHCHKPGGYCELLKEKEFSDPEILKQQNVV